MKVYIKDKIKENEKKNKLLVKQLEFISLCRKYLIPLQAVAKLINVSRSRIVAIEIGKSYFEKAHIVKLKTKEPFKSSEVLTNLLNELLNIIEG